MKSVIMMTAAAMMVTGLPYVATTFSVKLTPAVTSEAQATAIVNAIKGYAGYKDHFGDSPRMRVNVSGMATAATIEIYTNATNVTAARVETLSKLLNGAAFEIVPPTKSQVTGLTAKTNLDYVLSGVLDSAVAAEDVDALKAALTVANTALTVTAGDAYVRYDVTRLAATDTPTSATNLESATGKLKGTLEGLSRVATPSSEGKVTILKADLKMRQVRIVFGTAPDSTDDATALKTAVEAILSGKSITTTQAPVTVTVKNNVVLIALADDVSAATLTTLLGEFPNAKAVMTAQSPAKTYTTASAAAATTWTDTNKPEVLHLVLLKSAATGGTAVAARTADEVTLLKTLLGKEIGSTIAADVKYKVEIAAGSNVLYVEVLAAEDAVKTAVETAIGGTKTYKLTKAYKLTPTDAYLVYNTKASKGVISGQLSVAPTAAQVESVQTSLIGRVANAKAETMNATVHAGSKNVVIQYMDDALKAGIEGIKDADLVPAVFVRASELAETRPIVKTFHAIVEPAAPNASHAERLAALLLKKFDAAHVDAWFLKIVVTGVNVSVNVYESASEAAIGTVAGGAMFGSYPVDTTTYVVKAVPPPPATTNTTFKAVATYTATAAPVPTASEGALLKAEIEKGLTAHASAVRVTVDGAAVKVEMSATTAEQAVIAALGKNYTAGGKVFNVSGAKKADASPSSPSGTGNTDEEADYEVTLTLEAAPATDAEAKDLEESIELAIALQLVKEHPELAKLGGQRRAEMDDVLEVTVTKGSKTVLVKIYAVDEDEGVDITSADIKAAAVAALEGKDITTLGGKTYKVTAVDVKSNTGGSSGSSVAAIIIIIVVVIVIVVIAILIALYFLYMRKKKSPTIKPASSYDGAGSA